jgi:hypothetical protein
MFESNVQMNVSKRFLTGAVAMAAAFAGLFGVTSSAYAKGCWCDIKAGCHGAEIVSLGNVRELKELETNKKRKCSEACSNAAVNKADLVYDQDPTALCHEVGLSNGSVDLQAFSVVGSTDNNNNTCDVDQTVARLICEADCYCALGSVAISDPDGSVWCLGASSPGHQVLSRQICETVGTFY